MTNFIDTNINQTVLLDINYLGQLGKDNFDFYLYALLNKAHIFDEFLTRYKNKNVGPKAYPPGWRKESLFLLSFNQEALANMKTRRLV